jgi:hypothetical protein
VKIGTESGFIEIELKGRKGKGNLIIRRNLSATSKGSSFTLNGHSATGKEITSKMVELNVQVGNMWYAGALYCDSGLYSSPVSKFVPPPGQSFRVRCYEPSTALEGNTTRSWGRESDELARYFDQRWQGIETNAAGL